MILGENEIVFCPQCEGPHVAMTMMSGNTFGAIIWSDGWMDAPMMMEEPLVVVCQHCGAVFDPKVVARVQEAEYQKEEEGSHSFIHEASESQHIEYVNDLPDIQPELERRIRFRAFQMGNHESRKSGNPRRWSTQSISNARSLLQMCKSDVIGQLTRAEMYRSLKEFDESLDVLKCVTSDDELMSNIKEEMQAKAMERNSAVFTLTRPD